MAPGLHIKKLNFLKRENDEDSTKWGWEPSTCYLGQDFKNLRFLTTIILVLMTKYDTLLGSSLSNYPNIHAEPGLIKSCTAWACQPVFDARIFLRSSNISSWWLFCIMIIWLHIFQQYWSCCDASYFIWLCFIRRIQDYLQWEISEQWNDWCNKHCIFNFALLYNNNSQNGWWALTAGFLKNIICRQMLSEINLSWFWRLCFPYISIMIWF